MTEKCQECGHAEPHDSPPIQTCRACGCDGVGNWDDNEFFERLRAAIFDNRATEGN